MTTALENQTVVHYKLNGVTTDKINIVDMVQCKGDRNQTVIFMLNENEELLVIENDRVVDIGEKQIFNHVKGMHYNEDGSLIVLSHMEGGIIPIHGCRYNQSEITESNMGFRGFKMKNTVILASRYTNYACYDDPTQKDCRLNLHMSHDGQAQEWWLLFRGVTRYDIVNSYPGTRIGALILAYDRVTKSQTLYFCSDIAVSSKHVSVMHHVHDYYIVNERYLYIIKSLERMNSEYLYMFDLHNPVNSPFFDRPTPIKFMFNAKLSLTLSFKFLTFIKDPHTTLMTVQNQNEQVNKEQGLLYTSDTTRKHFAISLEDINMIDEEFPDLYQPKSLEFVILANKRVAHNDEENAQSRMERFHRDNQFTISTAQSNIQTVISFNNGGNWERLSVLDKVGQQVQCLPGQQNCHLNLYLEQSFSGILRAPQITSFDKQGYGTIIANGNVGRSLSNRVDVDFDTYMTTDGGYKWRKIADGAQLIKVIDELGMLVLAPFNEATDSIKYTLDGSVTGFKSVKFSSNDGQKYQVRSILKDSNQPTKLYLYVENSKGNFDMFSVDLKETLLQTERACQGEDNLKQKDTSDYEMYYMQNKHSKFLNSYPLCYMGAEQAFFRKKPSANCYIPHSPHPSHEPSEITRLLHRSQVKVSCPCQEQDFECDEGFEKLTSDSYQCFPIDHMKNDMLRADQDCQFGEYFYVPSGYRKIPGNYCMDGLQKDKKKKVYCTRGIKDQSLLILIWLALASAFVYIAYLFKQLYQEEIEMVRQWWRTKDQQDDISQEDRKKLLK